MSDVIFPRPRFDASSIKRRFAFHVICRKLNLSPDIDLTLHDNGDTSVLVARTYRAKNVVGAYSRLIYL